MKTLILLLGILGVTAFARASDTPAAAGRWDGVITLPTSDLNISVTLAHDAEGWNGTIDIPAQNTHGFKLDAINVDGASVAFDMPGVSGEPHFSGTISEDHKALSGDFSQGGMTFPFHLMRGDARSAPASSAAAAPESDLVRRLKDSTAGDKPGVAVLVARDGKILYQGGFGYADIEHKIPITPETKFRIGSITKQFTAAAILRLAQDGKLAITDPLAKYFPSFPNAEKITLRHLLTHTSGIHSYTEKSELIPRFTEPIEPEKVVALFENDPPDFAPGAGFHYDNSGYFLLGMIVTKVSGKPYADYLRDTFFAPLGMKDTGVYVNSAPPAGAAKGYGWASGKVEVAGDWDMSWAGGAGAIYSTVGDLWRWNEALFGGRVVDAASFKAMTTPVTLAPDADGMQYGFGLLIYTHKRLPVIGHGGGLPGWASELVEFPEQHCTVVALSNALPPLPGVGPAHLALDFADRFLSEDMKKAPSPEVDAAIDPKVFADYVGHYDYRTGILAVTTSGNRLFGQLTGQPKFQLFASAPDHYFVRVVDAELTFLRDKDGKVVAIHHAQNGQTFRAPKLELSGQRQTPQRLDTFVGKYQYGPNAVMTITRDGDYLFGQLTGQAKFPIFATADDAFEWHVVPASVRFVKDADGKVIKAVHTQNGRTFDAPRLDSEH